MLNYGRFLLNSALTGILINEGCPICYIEKSGKNMTEEPDKSEVDLPQKLPIDDPMNFPFHAAYVLYSELFDNIADSGARADLNRNIEALKENKIEPETFYRNIAHHRNLSPDKRHERFSLQTQRKRDWRKKAQRQDRIKRHKK
jgi:hypothetical protein